MNDDFVFVQDEECLVHWTADREWCQEDGNPDWLSLASLMFTSLVWLAATFSV